jgi:hypothetical protein
LQSHFASVSVSVSTKIIGFSCVDLKLDFFLHGNWNGKVGSTQKKGATSLGVYAYLMRHIYLKRKPFQGGCMEKAVILMGI